MPFHQRVKRVEELPRGIVAGWAVDVIDERHAGTPRRQPPDQGGAWCVGVNQSVVVGFDQPPQLLHHSQVESPRIGNSASGADFVFASHGKAERLDASESDVVAKLRQLASEEVLDALRARVMLAVDEMECSDCANLAFSADGRRSDGRRRQDCDGRGGRNLKWGSQHAQTLGGQAARVPSGWGQCESHARIAFAFSS